MPTGTVDYYDEDDGYGFIDTPVTEENVFFHISNLDGVETVEEGTELYFEVRTAERGPRAANLALASEKNNDTS